MRTSAPVIGRHPLRFGRRGVATAAQGSAGHGMADDLRLFATTFAAGFLFVSVLIF